jgi:hypothetical protein
MADSGMLKGDGRRRHAFVIENSTLALAELSQRWTSHDWLPARQDPKILLADATARAHNCTNTNTSISSPHLSSTTHSPASRSSAQLATPIAMTDKLPPTLLQLFAPRPPLRWVEPSDHAPEKRQTPNIGGIAQFMQAFKEYKDNDGYVPSDSWLQTRDRKKMEKKEKQEKLVEKAAEECTPQPQPNLHVYTG